MTRKIFIKLIQDNPDLAEELFRSFLDDDKDEQAKQAIRFSYLQHLHVSEIMEKMNVSSSRIYRLRQRGIRLMMHSSRRHIITNFLWRRDNG